MKNKTIYLVEDDRDISELMTIVLESESYGIKPFFASDKFTKTLEKQKPDLIIMDLSIGGTDGTSLVRKIKKDKENSKIPIILISAKNSLSEIAKGTKVSGFLPKPFDIKDLVKIVKKFL
ncbi:MAG TPA: response regulator [Candidatus Paceibacterota bacterium]